jgi:hypothetical protein
MGAAATASPAEAKMKTQPSPPLGYPLPLCAPAGPVRIARAGKVAGLDVGKIATPSFMGRRKHPPEDPLPGGSTWA